MRVGIDPRKYFSLSNGEPGIGVTLDSAWKMASPIPNVERRLNQRRFGEKLCASCGNDAKQVASCSRIYFLLDKRRGGSL